MQILLLESFFTGSHKEWAEGLTSNSRHDIEIISLPGRFWKWRMHGAAITFAQQVNARNTIPDLFLLTDMTDVSLFKANLQRRFLDTPIAVYFHENQITYPWSQTDVDVKFKRDRHYGFINYTSALIADKVFFNSDFHRRSFLQALNPFLERFPDHKNLNTVSEITSKSEVLYLGLDLEKFGKARDLFPEISHPIILWNHRWEYDKDPALFFKVLQELSKEDLMFSLIVTGPQKDKRPEVFDRIPSVFGERLLHFGYAESKIDYVSLVKSADILPVTSKQDFFGISVVEAIYSGIFPLLPNRLAYPEHFLDTFDQNIKPPNSSMSKYFYNSEDEFKDKLRALIFEESIKPHPSLSNRLSRYKWSVVISVYDQKFEQLLM